MEQNIIGSIRVEDLKLFLKKGLFDSEHFTENHFLISASVSYNINEIKKGEYLDYSSLAKILASEMQSEVQLLEKIASNCLEKILSQWSFALAVEIVIKKMHPDFAQLHMHAVVVKLNWEK